ncbi:MAG: carboxypeptidase-like regulatory domain-containing protein [Planctomycetota bacterium]
MTALVLGCGTLVGQSFDSGRAPVGFVPLDQEPVRETAHPPEVELASVERVVTDERHGPASRLSVDSAVTVEEESSPFIVRARLVDQAGAPAAHVEGFVSLHGPSVGTVASWRFGTGRDGRFEVGGVAQTGWVTVDAQHPSYGVAKAEFSREIAHGDTDLGDIVLTPLGVVTGEVRDLGGRPLPRLGVEALPVSPEDRVHAAFASTDEHGRFRFANLERVTYDITCHAARRAVRVTPDAHGLVLGLNVRSASVAVVRVDGEPFVGAKVTAEFAVGSEPSRPVRPRPMGLGQFELALPADPTRVVVAAEAVRDGRRWSGRAELATGEPHTAIELTIAPDDAVNVHLIVFGSDGDRISPFKATVWGGPHGAAPMEVRFYDTYTWLEPGLWSAHVEVGRSRRTVQFLAEFEVSPERVATGQRVKLRAPPGGSGVELLIRETADGEQPCRVRVRDAASSAVVFEGPWHRRRSPFALQLAPGEYTVAVDRPGPRFPAVRQTVVVTAGEFTRLELALP